MPPLDTILIVAAVFLFAGFIKGVIGVGMPTIALALLAATLGLKAGMALLVVPTIITNIWQASSGGGWLALARRLWPFLAAAFIATWFGVGLLARTDAALLLGLLGLLLCAYAGISLATPQIPPPGRHERWLSPGVGAVSGLLTGMTGSSIVPGVLYLQTLGLGRDKLVQAIGIALTCAMLALGISLAGHNLLPPSLGVLSVAALAPALAGMALGRVTRRRIPEVLFRRFFFAGLLLLGVYLAIRALG